MKTLLVFAVVLVLTAGLAYGQAGYIGLFADDTGTTCDLIDAGGTVTIYAIHMASSGATYSQWMVQGGGGFNMIWVSDNYAFICIDCGTTQEGIMVPYIGGCQASPYVMLSITYLAMGTSPTCSYLEVVADPDVASGRIEIVDCSATVLPAGGSILYVNPDGSCQCGEVAAKETSWGKIKKLYVD